MRWSLFLLPMVALAAAPEFHVETLPITGGAELVTVFGRAPEVHGQADVPLVSVLRDTLGDGNLQNDRLRYVWVLTSAKPDLLQRAFASLPFFYWRPDLWKSADHRPSPVIDLAAAGRGVPAELAGSLAQTLALDPSGTLIRSSTRSYRSNMRDYRRMNLTDGLAILSQFEEMPEAGSVFSQPEVFEIESRLTLAESTLGGLVREQTLPEAYLKQRTRTEEMRGHNWELLRQKAEADGLYFDPLGLGPVPTHALLWIAREDVCEKHAFDAHFLHIANPYGDTKLLKWKGYSTTRYFNESGRRVAAGTPGAKAVEMIPLALYSLDYPKVPLLLVDFRATHRPKHREMIRRATEEAITGVLGISKWSNWPYFVGSFAWNFVSTRHGANGSHAARLDAYAEVRQWLALDPSLSEPLRLDLQKRLELLGINPLEESVFDEAAVARRQYAALLKYANDPKGLPARLKKDREAELTSYDHGLKARVGLRMAHFATLGLYTHRERNTSTLTAELDRDRVAARDIRFLQNVAQSGPGAEVVWNMGEVRNAIDRLCAAGFEVRSAGVVKKILRQTHDEETREVAKRALEGLDAGAGQ